MLEQINTVVGAKRLIKIPATAAIFGRSGIGRTKVRGTEERPTRKAREKLSVARAERNMPRRRSEKDFIRRISWRFG
jgi:hypothetical protein